MRLPPFARMLVCVMAAGCAVVPPARSAEQSPSPVVHHDLAVTVDPATHRLKVRDRIRVPGVLVTAPFTLSLSADLSVQTGSNGLVLSQVNARVPGADSGIDRDD